MIPFYKQEKSWTCGAAALRMVLEACAIKKTEEEVVALLNSNEERGTFAKDFARVAKELNLQYVEKTNSSFDELRKALDENYFVILAYKLPTRDWDHYVVVKNIDENYIYLWDPAHGPNHKHDLQFFEKIWMLDPEYENQKKWFIGIKK